MAKFKLTDIQKLILSSAASRPAGNLLPPPEGLGELSAILRQAFEQLVKRGYAVEVETTEADQIWRNDEDKFFGLILSDTGRAAVAPAAEQANDTPISKGPKKIDQVIELLRRALGATLAEMVELTGWLPHTTRAALTGLRKKGYLIDKATRNGATCYLTAKAA